MLYVINDSTGDLKMIVSGPANQENMIREAVQKAEQVPVGQERCDNEFIEWEKLASELNHLDMTIMGYRSLDLPNNEILR